LQHLFELVTAEICGELFQCRDATLLRGCAPVAQAFRATGFIMVSACPNRFQALRLLQIELTQTGFSKIRIIYARQRLCCGRDYVEKDER